MRERQTINPINWAINQKADGLRKPAMVCNLLPRTLLALGLSILLSGCAAVLETDRQTSPQANDRVAVDQQAPETASAEADALAYRAFPEEVLYQLLVADIALIRGQFEYALEKYLQQARQTRDIAVVEMANRIASHQGDRDATLETALLWLEIKPSQAMAHRAALQAYALQKDPLKALQHAYWLYIHEDDIEAFLAVTAISDGTKQLLIEPLIQAYENLSLDREKQPAVKLAQAILYLESGRTDTALKTAEEYLALAPDNQRGLVFMAQVLYQQQRLDDALNLLEDGLERTPHSTGLRLQYARFLTLRDRPRAIVQFEMLRLKEPDNQQANFLLALLYLNQGALEPAEDLFIQAASDPSLYNDAYFRLGTIAERRGETGDALLYYRQVLGGNNYLAAASRVAQLLAEDNLGAARSYLQQLRLEQPDRSPELYQVESNLLVNSDRPEQAFNVLSQGLQAHPNHIQLLYARSMVAESQDNFELVERDLRALLAQDNDNSAALNALGYTMILHTDRREEAHRLIKRAYLLNPGDPAILDSLGWVLFVLGEPQQALFYLEKAMAMVVDPEIAAHLGEVQWFLGDREAALESWNRGLELDPHHETIRETMQRLDAEAFKIESMQKSIEMPIDKKSTENNL